MDSQCESSVDRVVQQRRSAATSAISLLQERRAALISAAVTGKIDLRTHFAQSLSEPESA
jgi:type I restriction enzyme S subunit